MQNIILNLLNKYHGNWDDVYNAVSNKESPNTNFDISQLPKDINICFIVNPEYNDKLKEIFLPPFFTFWKGNIKLLDNCVLGLSSSLSLEDYDLLSSKQDLSNEYTLCFRINDIEQHTVSNLISKGFNIILICNGGFNNLKFSNELKTNKLLLISEFWDTNSYQPSEEQTIERLIFALSNEIYINKVDSKVIKNLLTNYEHKHKPVYFHKGEEHTFLKCGDNEIEISYIRNIKDIFKLKQN